MGALMRVTREGIEELVAGDPEWWPGFCGAVVEGGYRAVLEERGVRGWSERAIMGWIFGDVGRLNEYTTALKLYSGKRVHRTCEVVDAGPALGEDVARDKLRYEQSFRYAEKVDPDNWGEKKAVVKGAQVAIQINLRRDVVDVVDVVDAVDVVEVVEDDEI